MRFPTVWFLPGSVLLLLAGCRGDRPGRGGAGPETVVDGFVLFSPLLSGTTYLVDRSGRAVHT